MLIYYHLVPEGYLFISFPRTQSFRVLAENNITVSNSVLMSNTVILFQRAAISYAGIYAATLVPCRYGFMVPGQHYAGIRF